MAENPTPAKVKKHYKAIRYFYFRLHCALNNAHNDEVIRYDNEKFREESPCYLMGQLKERIDKTTEKARAEAFKSECMNELKDVWY